MPYALDDAGRPAVLISSMAMHTQNLQADPRASLLVTPPGLGPQREESDDPLARARLTLMGDARVVPPAEVSAARAAYLARHARAAYWVDFEDFAFWRLEVTDLYFVGGFAAMDWVSAAAYFAAAPDPLADVADGIVEHMNRDHADALVAYARLYAGEEADAATMVAVGGLWLAARYGPRHGALLLLVGAALGLTLHHAVFGFTAAYRALVTVGDGRGVRAQLLMLAVATVLFAPVLAAGEIFGASVAGAVAPAGVSVLVGAFVFGVGMQIAGGGGAGVLYHPGAGVTPLLAPLVGFVAGAGHAVVHHLGLRALGREGARRDGIRPLGRRVLVGRVPADGARGAHPRRRHVGHGPRAGPGRAARRGARRPLRPAASRPGAPRRRGGPGRAPPRVRLTDRLWL